MALRIAQVVESTQAEGPGHRFALWVQGCTLRCPGCCNPEMFAAAGGTQLEPTALAARVTGLKGVEGLSVLGGEPFEQAQDVAELCEAVRAAGLTVMVYSGYTLEELRAKHDPHVDRLLQATDVLVDGRYRQELPETKRRWVGSANQQLHFLSDRGRRDQGRFEAPNTVELRLDRAGLTVNGWPALADSVRAGLRRP